LAEPTRRETIAWIQAGLVLLFFALMLALYLAPEGSDPGGRPDWWTWVVVAMPAAAALILQFWRRGPRV